jgi:hypothetical protein
MLEANMINNSNKKIVNSILSGLLLGSAIVLTMPIQASQQPSRGSRTPQPRRNVQENREPKNEPTGLTKKEAAKLLSEGHEAVQKFISSQKERREKNKRIRIHYERLAPKKA